MNLTWHLRLGSTDIRDVHRTTEWQATTVTQLVTAAPSTCTAVQVTSQFVDIGTSRRVPLRCRPQASRLWAALACPDRGFDALVVADAAHTASRQDLDDLHAHCRAHRVALWLAPLPEPITSDPAQASLLLTLLTGVDTPAPIPWPPPRRADPWPHPQQRHGRTRRGGRA